MTTMIAEDLFRVEDGRAVLMGSRRKSTSVARFPAERPELFDGNPETQADIEPIELATEGVLFTYTTQQFAPPFPYLGDRTPEGFKPYIVGYVELPEGLLVESLIVGTSAADLRIGMRMVSTTVELEFADGRYLTFAFTPA